MKARRVAAIRWGDDDRARVRDAEFIARAVEVGLVDEAIGELAIHERHDVPRVKVLAVVDEHIGVELDRGE